MTLPPTALVRDALLETVLPPIAAAAVGYGLILLAFGRRASSLAAVLALVAGWAAGNHFRAVAPWLPDDSSRRLKLLPIAAGAAAVAGLIVRSHAAGWAVWAAVLAFITARVLPNDLVTQRWWAAPAFVLLATAVGFGAQQKRLAGLLTSAALFAAGTVAVHAHSGRLADAAVVAGAALFGLTALALLTKSDATTCLPGAAVLLAGVSLLAYDETFEHAVPATAFVLPAVAPLPLLLGRRFRAVQYALGLLLVAAGVGLAAYNEPLDFENL